MPDRIWIAEYSYTPESPNRTAEDDEMKRLDMHTRAGFHGYYKHTPERESAEEMLYALKRCVYVMRWYEHGPEYQASLWEAKDILATIEKEKNNASKEN